MSHLILISDFPLPPSINQGHRNVPGIGRVSAEPLRKFKNEVRAWRMAHGRNIVSAFQSLMLKEWSGSTAFKVTYHFIFKHERIYTKAGAPKVLDADSRIKFAQDALFESLGIDDKFVFCGEFEKVTGEKEGCVITIQPYTPITSVELFQTFNHEFPTTQSEQ